MGTTPKLGLRYPDAANPPDGPGGFYNLATDLDNALTIGTWGPGLGGGGATMGGSGAASEGTWTKQGNVYRFIGTLLFGSGAAWGTDSVITNVPATLNTATASGTGWFKPVSGTFQQIFFYAAGPSLFRILQPLQGSSAAASNIGTPANGDRLTFVLHGSAA